MPLAGDAKKAYDREYGKKNRKRLNKNSLEWHYKNLRNSTSSKLKYRYGITIDDYEWLLVEQHGVCAICKQPETRRDPRNNKTTSLAIDHNHTTKKVRGLLCSACNRAIGFMNEDPARLLAAAIYIEQHSKE